jgi:hypothetical protein
MALSRSRPEMCRAGVIAAAGVVELERVRGHAVRERSVARAELGRGAPHRRARARRIEREQALHLARLESRAAGERGAQRVEQMLLGTRDECGRQLVEAGLGAEASELQCGAVSAHEVKAGTPCCSGASTSTG